MNLTPTKNSPAPPRRRTPKFPRSPCGRRPDFGVPITPLLRWKLEDRHGSRGRVRLQFQARKLAAGLWQLHYREISGCGGSGRRESQNNYYRRRDESRNGGEQKLLERRHCFDSSNKGIKMKAAAEYWNPETPEAAEGAVLGRFYSHRGGGEQPFTAASAVSDLKEELAVAQSRIRKLESQQRNSKKKSEHLKEKLEENRGIWKNRKQSKLEELDQERKTHHRTEMVNANLAIDLAEAKAVVKKYKQEYEKEKKNRVLLEEVCTEMAKQIGGDKAKVEALKRESKKLYEELEEERNMLQMAEVWREERVQMKLIDAKLALEEKYIQMNKLITELENFLMSRSEKLEEMEVKRSELIDESAKSLDIEEIEDLKEARKLEEIAKSVEKECVSEKPLFEDCCSRKKVNFESVSERKSQNPHIRRGTNGCIEWPRRIQKNCFKTKPLDAMIQSQKSQLRHVLKHRMN